MLASRFYSFFCTFFLIVTLSQGQDIELYNPSWEDFPHMGVNFGLDIRGWKDCGFRGETPPDIHSGNGFNTFFDVVHHAQNGETFLGMVARENETWEAVSQRLSTPLKTNKCYSFTINLSKTDVYNSTVHGFNGVKSFTSPIVLRIHGGNSSCDRKELLAESEPISNREWETFVFKFEPKSSHRFIVFEAFYKTPTLFPYNGNILLDNASPISVIACDDEPYAYVDIQEASDERNDLPPVKIQKPVVPSSKKNTKKKKPSSSNNNLKYNQTKKTTISKKPLKTLTNIPELNEELNTDQIIELNKLRFEADSSNLLEASIPVLKDLYEYLKQNRKVIVEIGGHTNGLPPHNYCDDLSRKRAKAIRDYLKKMGISTYQVRFKGYGKRQPVASNKTASGRKLNQRVEIKILSKRG